MRKFNSILTVFCGVVLLFTACKKTDDTKDGIPDPEEVNSILPISDLREVYKSSSVVLGKSNMKNAVSISGIVISDPENGNSPLNKIILQGSKAGEIRGITLDVGAEYSNYKFGDSITVQVEGLALNQKDGILQIVNVPAASITKNSQGNSPKVNGVLNSIAELESNLEKYESTLVKIPNMRLVTSLRDLTFGQGFELSDSEDEIAVSINPNASFAEELVPKLADYTFVVLRNENREPALWLINLNDLNIREAGGRDVSLYEGFPEDFSDAIPAFDYGIERSVLLPTSKLQWKFMGAHIQESTNFLFPNAGDYMAVLFNKFQDGRGGFIELDQDLPDGASKIGVYLYVATASDLVEGKLPIEVKLEYSQDSGNTWHQIGDIISITENKRYLEDLIDVDITGPVRFKVSFVGTGKERGRLGLDYFRVYKNKL